MRKSRVTTAARGNVRKSDSFREAWARIKLATREGFYLEAVAIQESIIFDRLLAHLHRAHDYPLQTRNGGHHKLGDLVRELRKCEPERQLRNGAGMADAIKAWADQRNRVVHSIVRSEPGAPTRPVDEFLALARDASRDGAALAREVSRLKVARPGKSQAD